MNERKTNIKKLFISESLKTCTEFYKSKKFRIFSHHYRNINKKNSQFSSNIKTLTINNIHAKNFFDSFHKSLMHRKISSNRKYNQIENKIFYTERDDKKKSYENTNLQNTPNINNKFEKLFLTNFNDTDKNDKKYKTRKYINRPFNLLNRQYNTEILDNKNNSKIYIHSNVFLPLDLKKYKNTDYPDILYPKISDFIEDIKMLRKCKFINILKKEQYQQKYALTGFDNETQDITIHSLKSSIKLLNCYKSSFFNYNKFLIERIKEEKKILSNYIIDENILKDEVLLIQKKFDDLMLQLEILNNFKLLFDAIQNKTKIKKYDELSDKTFAEITKEKLKQKILFHKKSTLHLSPRKLLKKSTKALDKEKVMQINNNYLNNKSLNKNKKKEEKEEKDNNNDKKPHRYNRKFQTIIHVKFNNKLRLIDEKKKQIERLKSLQPSMNLIENNIDEINKEKKKDKVQKKVRFEEFDVRKELKRIQNNIIKLIDIYNDVDSSVVNFKLSFYKESHSIENLLLKKEIEENIYELNYCKRYNALLISKLNLVKSQNNDYSLFISIYHKFNELIKYIKDYKIKNYQISINKLNNIYDKNKIYISYKNEKKENRAKIAYLEGELINYIYKVFIIIEKLVYELIEGKNNYLKSNYFSERIEEFENKIDNAKKLFNSRNKKSEEILRREKLKENTIKKLNKIIYLTRKKIMEKYKVINIHKIKRNKNGKDFIEENLLYY